MKKILFVCPSLAAGGAERTAVAVANYLAETGLYEISFKIFFNNLYLKDLLDSNIKLLNDDLIEIEEKKMRTLKSISFFRTLLKKEKFDIIISTNELSSEIPILFSKNLIPAETKLISVIQNTTEQLFKTYNLKTKLLYALVKLLRSNIFDKLIAVSSHVKKEFKSSEKIEVIPNPLTITESIEEIIAKYQKKCINNKYFISVSRISKQKNLSLLLEAFKLVENKIPHNLIILGSIGEKEEYQKLLLQIEKLNLSERVTFLLPGEEYLSRLINAEAFLFSSRFEGFPLALLEAMYCKVPVISTKFIGHEEIINDNTAELCTGFSEKEFADRILQFVNSGRNEEKINSAHNFSKNFSSKIIGEKYHKLILECYR